MHQRAKASAQAVFTTGASRGIGFDCARFLAERGYRSLGSVRRERDLDRLREAGIEPVLMDVADRASVLRAGVEVERLLAGTRLRALVNNAGVPAAGPIELADLDEARSVFEVNFFGTLAVTRTFLPLLRASGGRVINMSSLSGRSVFPFIGIYAASKHALEAASDALRRELLTAGVDVILIEPGSVQTSIWDQIESIDVNQFRGSPYEHVMRAAQKAAVSGGRAGIPVERVSRAVYRAVSERHPPARIPVVESRLRWVLRRLLPARLLDRLIGRRLARLESIRDPGAV
jgi:short-subunit dehydrogenase